MEELDAFSVEMRKAQHIPLHVRCSQPLPCLGTAVHHFLAHRPRPGGLEGCGRVVRGGAGAPMLTSTSTAMTKRSDVSAACVHSCHTQHFLLRCAWEAGNAKDSRPCPGGVTDPPGTLQQRCMARPYGSKSTYLAARNADHTCSANTHDRPSCTEERRETDKQRSAGREIPQYAGLLCSRPPRTRPR